MYLEIYHGHIIILYIKKGFINKKNDKWYYAGSDGKILKNPTTPDGYWVNSQGIWQ